MEEGVGEMWYWMGGWGGVPGAVGAPGRGGYGERRRPCQDSEGTPNPKSEILSFASATRDMKHETLGAKAVSQLVDLRPKVEIRTSTTETRTPET